MRNVRKIISVLLAPACLIALVGCSGNTADSPVSEPSAEMSIPSSPATENNTSGEEAESAPPKENKTAEVTNSNEPSSPSNEPSSPSTGSNASGEETQSSSSAAVTDSPIVESSLNRQSDQSERKTDPLIMETSPDRQSNQSERNTDPPIVEPSTQTGGDTMPTMNIQVGSVNFRVILYDNVSTRTLLEQMPLTLNMSELNGNEKYYYLQGSLPTASQRVGSINTGDLMLYGADCLVLFYESFSTSYSYTRLGYIEDASGLVDVLGSGSVQVTFRVDG